VLQPDRFRQQVVRSNDLFTSVTGNAGGGDRRSSSARGRPTDPRTACRRRRRSRPPATAPIGPATRRPVPAPAPAPTQSARAIGTATNTAAASAAVANRSFFIWFVPRLYSPAASRDRRGEPAPQTRISHKFVAKLGRILDRPTSRFACVHPPTITCRLISAMLLTPVSAIVTSSSLRMISMARATPACPPAPRPYT